MDSHPAQADLLHRLKKRCAQLEDEKAELQEQLEEARRP
jgi:hypothetical protein